jgi:hypothetical protein
LGQEIFEDDKMPVTVSDGEDVIKCLPARRNGPLSEKESRYFERRQTTLALGCVPRYEKPYQKVFIISPASEPLLAENYLCCEERAASLPVLMRGVLAHRMAL